jgi:hypothetical protein
MKCSDIPAIANIQFRIVSPVHYLENTTALITQYLACPEGRDYLGLRKNEQKDGENSRMKTFVTCTLQVTDLMLE